MNKYVKLKKHNKLYYKQIFPKEDKIFITKYPILYFICRVNNISLHVVNKNKKKLSKVKIVESNIFEMMYRILICAKQENYNYQTGSKGDYYKKLFKEANISI